MVKILIDANSKSKLYRIPINLTQISSFSLHFTTENLKVTDQTNNVEITELVLRDFELSQPEHSLTEQEMLNYLADAIAYMLENKMDFLLSLMYRLDIDEAKIAHALLPGNDEPAHIALAKVVWERQKNRVATKQAYRIQNPTNWNWDDE